MAVGRPDLHTPEHDDWDAGGYCNVLVLDDDQTAEVCTYQQPDAAERERRLEERARVGTSLRNLAIGGGDAQVLATRPNRLVLPVKRLHPAAELPTFAHDGDAGADLFCTQKVILSPNGGVDLVPTGLALEIPTGHVGLIHPRSGLAARDRVTVLNAPGTIDAGYRGEVKVLLINHGGVRVTLKPGTRIAQLLIQEVILPEYLEVEELLGSSRGEGGFGSTGA